MVKQSAAAQRKAEAEAKKAAKAATAVANSSQAAVAAGPRASKGSAKEARAEALAEAPTSTSQAVATAVDKAADKGEAELQADADSSQVQHAAPAQVSLESKPLLRSSHMCQELTDLRLMAWSDCLSLSQLKMGNSPCSLESFAFDTYRQHMQHVTGMGIHWCASCQNVRDDLLLLALQCDCTFAMAIPRHADSACYRCILLCSVPSG